MPRGLVTWAIALVALAAVLLGLALVGGPDHARQQDRDRQRDQDLAQLASWAICLANETGALPQVLAPSPACDWRVPDADPRTGAAYRYQVTGPNAFRLCADYELPPPRPGDRWARDAQGCLGRDWWPERRQP